MPDYYWSRENGEEIGKTLTGQFGVGTKQEEKYKITFINVATEDVIRNIKITSEVSQQQ